MRNALFAMVAATVVCTGCGGSNSSGNQQAHTEQMITPPKVQTPVHNQSTPPTVVGGQSSPKPILPSASSPAPALPTPTLPVTAESQPTPRPAVSLPQVTGEYSKIAQSGTWEYGLNNIPVFYDFGLESDYSDSGYIAKTKWVAFDQPIAAADQGYYNFYKIGDVGYYGYRQELDMAKEGMLKNYFYSIDQRFVNAEAPKGRYYYYKEDGFIYGTTKAGKSAANRIHKTADVELFYDNGTIVGNIIGEDFRGSREILFKISGGLNNMLITPQPNNQLDITPKDRAIIDHSPVVKSANNNHQHIVGLVKGSDQWTGVLAADFQKTY